MEKEEYVSVQVLNKLQKLTSAPLAAFQTKDP